MSSLYLALALVLLVNVAIGLIRISRGPTAADRMLAAQLFGSGGVAILILLGRGLGQDSGDDVALVYALLAALATVAFVRRAWLPRPPEQRGEKDD